MQLSVKKWNFPQVCIYFLAFPSLLFALQRQSLLNIWLTPSTLRMPKQHIEKPVSVRKPSPGQTQSSVTLANQQLAGGWTGSKSWELTAPNRQTGSISFAFQSDSGIPTLHSLDRLKCVGLTSSRPSLSGYWPERFSHALVTRLTLSHGEGIDHFSLQEEGRPCANGGLQMWLLPGTSDHGQGPGDG